MAALPLALFAFAAGATLLQWQPELPRIAPLLVAGALIGSVAAVVRALAARVAHGTTGSPSPSTFRWRIVAGARRAIAFVSLLALAAGTAALGFGYAAWRAEHRLADALPPEWEGVDIALVGIVDELPQSSPRGTRFAFAVERIETPRAVVPARISLAWSRRPARTARASRRH